MPSLDQLEIGQCARIQEVSGGDALGQRLLEMGLLEGEPVEVLGFAPFGDPMEIRLRDYRLSLRKREATRVRVEVSETAFAPLAHDNSDTISPAPSVSERVSQEPSPALGAGKKTLTVALVGNPNTGKTTLFNSLTGLRHRVGNYPGVTVEMKKGRATHNGRTCDIIDLPGTYSFAARSPDEMVAVDLLLGQVSGEPMPDVVIAIVDASNLDRHLYLVTQLLELGRPTVIALNMLDIAAKHGISVDAHLLSERLEIPVVPIQANAGAG